MQSYGLGYLDETFKRHSEEAQKNHERMVNAWKNENSSDAIPDHLKSDFNLPLALGSIVKEIRRLERMIQDMSLRNYMIASSTIAQPEHSDG